jgi:hypothetical protein
MQKLLMTLLKTILYRVILVSFLTLSQGCGVIGVGSGGSTIINDARPTGTVVGQGSFSGLNGQAASGTAILFLEGSVYTLRLEGVSLPTLSGLLVQVYTTGGLLAGNFTLRAATGNQNYTLSGVLVGTSFSSVNIYSNTAIMNYASAIILR